MTDSTELLPPPVEPGPKANRLLTALASLAVVVALGATAVAGIALKKANDSAAELQKSRAGASSLANRLGSLEDDVSSMKADVNSAAYDISQIRSDLGSIVDPSAGMANLGSRIDDLEYGLSLIASGIKAVSSNVDDLASCVNDYMDTIGRWSGNVYSRYTYYTC
jgi:uncharacterized phage infection (PIP) family protein YhgE